MFENLRSNIKDNRFKIIIYQDKVNINNFEKVLVFEDNIVLVLTGFGTVKINGSNLCITRLENYEILVEGVIKSVDLGEINV